MKNWEYYKNDIKRYGVDRFDIKKDGTAIKCYDIQCKECRFFNDCVMEKTEFLYREHKETIKLIQLEFELLRHFKYKGFKYITRDLNYVCLALYKYKPKKEEDYWYDTHDSDYSIIIFKELFPFIKWEDEEPVLIQDILDNCEVIEDK